MEPEEVDESLHRNVRHYCVYQGKKGIFLFAAFILSSNSNVWLERGISAKQRASRALCHWDKVKFLPSSPLPFSPKFVRSP